MKRLVFLGLAGFSLCLSAEEKNQANELLPRTPCSSCDKGSSRLAALMGSTPSPGSELGGAGESITLVLPTLKDQKTTEKLSVIINNLDGAFLERSCLNSHCAFIKYEPERVTKAKIINEIGKLGIEMEGEKISCQVEGMTCSQSSEKLKEILAGTQGIVRVESVSHERNSVTLVIDPEKTNTTKIAGVLKKSGFSVVD